MPLMSMEVEPLDPVYLSKLPRDVQIAIHSAERRAREGAGERVPHAEIERIVERQRRQQGG